MVSAHTAVYLYAPLAPSAELECGSLENMWTFFAFSGVLMYESTLVCMYAVIVCEIEHTKCAKLCTYVSFLTFVCVYLLLAGMTYAEIEEADQEEFLMRKKDKLGEFSFSRPSGQACCNSIQFDFLSRS